MNTPLVMQMCHTGRVTPLDTQMCQTGSANNTPLVTQTCQLESSTPLVTRMCQTGSASPMVLSENVLAAIVLHLVGWQNTLDDTSHDCSDPRGSQQEEDNQGGHQLNVRNSDNDPHSLRLIVESVVNFDPHSVAAEDGFTFEAHSSINEYLEEHMRYTLDKKLESRCTETIPSLTHPL